MDTLTKSLTPYPNRRNHVTPQQEIPFVELLGRSNFSFLQGASHPEEMVLQGRALGYRGFGLCDLNGLYGVVRAYTALTRPSRFMVDEWGLLDQPYSYHVGAELQLSDQSSIALYPMNKEGYINLCQLITLAKRNVPKSYSCLDLQDIINHSDDIIIAPLPPWNRQTLKRLQEAFYDRLYLPVCKDFTWQSLQNYNQALIYETEMSLQLFATQRPFMHHKENKDLMDVVTCILHGTTLEKAKALLTSNSERVLKPLSELKKIWRDRPDILTKSAEISERLNFSLEEITYQYPQAAIPERMEGAEYLAQETFKGLRKRFPKGVPLKVQTIVQKELDLITELQFQDYFLTLSDICKFARSQGILYQGRGSAANSIVCYALELTAVDPTKIDLLFERFISKERGDPPDIDIDFESQRREEVIQYIYQKYGSLHAAMVCTVITYRAKMSLRETGKALGIPSHTINQLIQFMGRDGLKRLIENPSKAQALGLSAKKFELLINLAHRIKGFPRHLGIHTGGFVITQRPITECVPVESATMDQRFVIQWNKDDIETLKMMKIDVLGLGMLTALQKCFEMLKTDKDISLNLATLPQGDKATYQMIQKADTVGVFQIESRAQMGLLPRVRPECFYDLVVEVAIVRPGPIKGGMVHPYVRRRRGLEKVNYAHKDLIPILGKTLGVPIFQEQIMQIASAVCGFTPGEADELRRVMSSGWIRPKQMQGLRNRILNGMLSHGIKKEYAEQIYNTIEGFSSYGFPESHAASFALLTYASCYLKWHHPDIFVCALLNSQPMGFYSPRALVADAERHKVAFLPLCIQHSEFDYFLEATPEHPRKHSVRIGFRAIKGIKKTYIEHLVKERLAHGHFKDLADLIQRTHLPKSLLMALGAAGALESMGLEVRSALWALQSLSFDENSLFFGLPKERFDQMKNDPLNSEGFPGESQWDKLQREYHWQGFSRNTHPLSILRPTINKWSEYYKSHKYVPFSQSKDLKKIPSNNPIRIAGLLSMYQRPPTAKGFAFLSLEDEDGLFNAVLTPRVFSEYRDIISKNYFIEVQGHLEKFQGVINVKAQKLKAINITEATGSKL